METTAVVNDMTVEPNATAVDEITIQAVAITTITLQYCELQPKERLAMLAGVIKCVLDEGDIKLFRALKYSEHDAEILYEQLESIEKQLDNLRKHW